MESRPRDLIVIERVLDAMREIGVLLVAFAPLDFAVAGTPITRAWPYLAGFLAVGFMLLTFSIFIEWRLQRWLASSYPSG